MRTNSTVLLLVCCSERFEITGPVASEFLEVTNWGDHLVTIPAVVDNTYLIALENIGYLHIAGQDEFAAAFC